MSLNLEEIWKLQGELNTIIGRDTINDPNKHEWIFDYAIALHDEATEMFNCCNWKFWSSEGRDKQYLKIIDYKNAKIEAVDCLHFLISLMQVCNYKLDIDYYETFWTDINKSLKGKHKVLSKYSVDLISDSVMLMNTVQDFLDDDSINVFERKYPKEFKNQLDENNELFQIILKNCMTLLITVFVILDFEKEDLLKIYKMKHEKNMLRQKNGYSVINKTEADNDEIKNNI